MFRKFNLFSALLAVLLLIACTGEKQKNVTTMPLLPYGYEVSLKKNCEWTNEKVPINIQENESVRFRVQKCPAEEIKISDKVVYSQFSTPWNYAYVETKYGTGVQAYLSNSKKKNMQFGIAKLGPLSKKRFIDMYLDMHKVRGECEALKQDPYAYTIIRSNYRDYVGFDIIEDEPWNEFMARLNMYRAISGKSGHGKKCMQFPTLIFANDVVFILPYNSYANGIDYQSIKFMSES